MSAFAAPLLHGFGQRYDLPLSLPIYLFAAAAVVVLSFVMVVAFGGDAAGRDAGGHYPRRRVLWLDRILNSTLLRWVGHGVGLLGAAAIIACGLFGSRTAFLNPAEYLLWIVFWGGAVIISGVVGNLWTWFSPFNVLLAAGGTRTPAFTLPRWLGVWPAVAAYFLFACLELTSGLASHPPVVAVALLGYGALTALGVALCGRDWLARCEVFTVLFGLVSRMGIIGTERNRAGRAEAYLRFPAAGLLGDEQPGWDRITFVILTLSSLAFDGLLATQSWVDFYHFTRLGQVEARTLGLLLLTLAFMAFFVGVMWAVIRLGGAPGRTQVLATMSAFALTLLPIALVYNLAHNYTYLVVNIQYLVPLLGDPLQRGWHLLPTAGYQPSLALAGAALVWYLQVSLIVLGHVAAVWLAHLRAGERFRSGNRALLSQYPMLLLMVGYTMTSLWIIGQSSTRGG